MEGFDNVRLGLCGAEEYGTIEMRRRHLSLAKVFHGCLTGQGVDLDADAQASRAHARNA